MERVERKGKNNKGYNTREKKRVREQKDWKRTNDGKEKKHRTKLNGEKRITENQNKEEIMREKRERKNEIEKTKREKENKRK